MSDLAIPAPVLAPSSEEQRAIADLRLPSPAETAANVAKLAKDGAALREARGQTSTPEADELVNSQRELLTKFDAANAEVARLRSLKLEEDKDRERRADAAAMIIEDEWRFS